MAADFGLSGYDKAQLEEMFGMLRGLRVGAGDFTDRAVTARSPDAPAS